MTRKRKVRFEPLGITIACSETEPILQVALRLDPPPAARKPKAVVVGAKYTFADLVGQSVAFRNATKIGLIAAGNTLSVLIAGESGTGKEMLAHAIHASSPRAPKPFRWGLRGRIPAASQAPSSAPRCTSW